MSPAQNLPRTAPDPAWSEEDYESEATLAVLEERVPASHKNCYRKRHERDICRRRGNFLRKIHNMAHRPSASALDPSEAVAGHEALVERCSKLARTDPEALLAASLRAVGLDGNEIAQVLHRSAGHVSRLRRRAQLDAGLFD